MKLPPLRTMTNRDDEGEIGSAIREIQEKAKLIKDRTTTITNIMYNGNDMRYRRRRPEETLYLPPLLQRILFLGFQVTSNQ